MFALFEHYKKNFKLYITILCSVIFFVQLMTFVFIASGNANFLGILITLLKLLLYGVFFGFIVYSMYTYKPEVYKVLIPIYFSSILLNYFLDTFDDVTNLFDSSSALYGFTAFFKMFLSISLGLLAFFAIYQVIKLDYNEQLMFILAIVTLSLVAFSFIFELIVLIVGHAGFFTILLLLLSLPVSFITIMTIATKTFFFDESNDPVMVVQTNASDYCALVDDPQEEAKEKDALEENGIPQ